MQAPMTEILVTQSISPEIEPNISLKQESEKRVRVHPSPDRNSKPSISFVQQSERGIDHILQWRYISSVGSIDNVIHEQGCGRGSVFSSHIIARPQIGKLHCTSHCRSTNRQAVLERGRRLLKATNSSLQTMIQSQGVLKKVWTHNSAHTICAYLISLYMGQNL